MTSPPRPQPAPTPRDDEARAVTTDSGLAVAPYYDAPDPPADLPPPGTYPYTRGIHAPTDRARSPTPRPQSGIGTADAANAHLRSLVAAGQTALSVAFDLPTQRGYDADDPLAAGAVGAAGVSLCTLDDMRALCAGIPLADVRTTFAVDAPAAILLLMYRIVAEESGVAAAALGGAVRDDILAQYQAGGGYIFPPGPSMRLVTDTLGYCTRGLPRWNPLVINGYDLREAGCSAAQEIAFALSNAVAYVEAGRGAGLAVDAFVPRLSFVFGAHNDLFEEVAKFRAARRLWATIMREWFGAKNPLSLLLRFHTRTCESTLAAQQPRNNAVRVAVQALAAMLGGAQSLDTLAYDAVFAPPSDEAAALALRTQQILAAESGVVLTADPLGGSFYVESLTDRMEAEARRIMEGVARRGGAVAATESGYIAGAIAEHAYAQATLVERGERVIVGVNRHVEEDATAPPIPRPDAGAEARQRQRLAAHRAARNAIACDTALGVLRGAAADEGELMTPLRSCIVAGATVGEICAALRAVWGSYIAPRPI